MSKGTVTNVSLRGWCVDFSTESLRVGHLPGAIGRDPRTLGREEYPDQSLVVLESQQTRIRRFPPDKDDD